MNLIKISQHEVNCHLFFNDQSSHTHYYHVPDDSILCGHNISNNISSNILIPFMWPWYLQNVLKNSNIPFSVGCYFAWKPQCAPKILWMIDNCNKFLRNKTKDCESTFKNKEITALTFFAKKSNFYSKNWKLRISWIIKRFGEHFRLFSQINVQLAIIK